MTILENIPLEDSNKNKYTSFIFVNGYYYLLAPSLGRIVRYDYGLNSIEVYNMKAQYKCIAYNKGSNIFYLVRESDSYDIHVTDVEFNEIGLIKINVPQKYTGIINSLCYCNNKKRIYITTNDYVYSVTEEGYFIKEEYSINRIGSIPVIKMVKWIDGCYHSTQVNIKIPNTYLTCCFLSDDILYIGYVRDKSARLIKSMLNRNVIEDKIIENAVRINGIFGVYDRLNLLMCDNKSFNHMGITDLKICIKRRRRGRRKLSCYDNIYKLKCELYKNSVLESIALIESSLSCVLNLEGNKMQKIIEQANSINEILEVNKSINRTINNIIILEQILLHKLEYGLNISENNKYI